jgi:26S proteasome regulatory subunit T3
VWIWGLFVKPFLLLLCVAFQISAICQEAGMHAVRKNRYVILPKDFEKGYRTNVKKPDTDFDFYK